MNNPAKAIHSIPISKSGSVSSVHVCSVNENTITSTPIVRGIAYKIIYKLCISIILSTYLLRSKYSCTRSSLDFFICSFLDTFRFSRWNDISVNVKSIMITPNIITEKVNPSIIQNSHFPYLFYSY